MFRAYFHTVANKKKMTSVVEKIGFSAAQANILNVLGKYSFVCRQKHYLSVHQLIDAW